MSRHPLDGLSAKLDRADECLGTLHDEFGRLLHDEPLVINAEVDFKSGWHTAKVPGREPPPPRLSVLAGESLYQARSSLEHLRRLIESWLSKLKERLVWRSQLETLEQAREEIGAYIDRYHRRPHSGLGYRTPLDVRATRDDPFVYRNTRPEVSTGTSPVPSGFCRRS